MEDESNRSMSTHAVRAHKSRLAVASFLAGLGVVVGPLLTAGLNRTEVFSPVAALMLGAALSCPPVAVALGVVALHEIRRSDETIGGRALAITGLVLGAVEIIAPAVLIAIFIEF
jgi:hypothetical protein